MSVTETTTVHEMKISMKPSERYEVALTTETLQRVRRDMSDLSERAHRLYVACEIARGRAEAQYDRHQVSREAVDGLSAFIADFTGLTELHNAMSDLASDFDPDCHATEWRDEVEAGLLIDGQ